MKLHLPSGLRKALLACLAAVALPTATIPTTIASASGIAAVFLVTSQRASADQKMEDETTLIDEEAVSESAEEEEDPYGIMTVATGDAISIAGGGEAHTVQTGGEEAPSLTLTGETGDALIAFQRSGDTLTITGQVTGSDPDVNLRVVPDQDTKTGIVVFEQGGSIAGSLNVFQQAEIKLGKAGSSGVTLSVGKLGGNGFKFTAADTNEVTLQITGGDAS